MYYNLYGCSTPERSYNILKRHTSFTEVLYKVQGRHLAQHQRVFKTTIEFGPHIEFFNYLEMADQSQMPNPTSIDMVGQIVM